MGASRRRSCSSAARVQRTARAGSPASSARAASRSSAVDEPVAVGVLRLERPLVGEIGQQRARREGDGPLERGAVAGAASRSNSSASTLPRQVAGEADVRPVGRQVGAAADRVERPRGRPRGRFAATPARWCRARRARSGPPGARAGAARGAAAGRRAASAAAGPGIGRHLAPVHLDAEPAEEPRAQHGVIRHPGGRRSTAGGAIPHAPREKSRFPHTGRTLRRIASLAEMTGTRMLRHALRR